MSLLSLSWALSSCCVPISWYNIQSFCVRIELATLEYKNCIFHYLVTSERLNLCVSLAFIFKLSRCYCIDWNGNFFNTDSCKSRKIPLFSSPWLELVRTYFCVFFALLEAVVWFSQQLLCQGLVQTLSEKWNLHEGILEHGFRHSGSF